MALYQSLLQESQTFGFPLAGGVDIDSVESFSDHVQRYDQWLEKGFAGEMEYLRRGRDRRADPRLVFPKAQSVFCVATPYWRAPIGDGKTAPRYARYLKGGDYHERILENFEKMLQRVRESHPGLEWKICIDHSAVLERSWAVLAGLGWIGKNTTLIHPKYGSYLFLSEALLSEPVGQGPKPLPNYCGNCTRCLDACPTKAFSGPGSLDSRRCISYWTLEKRGQLDISETDRKSIGPWIAGCDICQEVCPFNIKPSRQNPEGLERTIKQDKDALDEKDWIRLLRETEEEYRARIRNSALSRVKPAQFSRNLAIALSNTDRSVWTQELLTEVRRRADEEKDEAARAEWARCLERIES